MKQDGMDRMLSLICLCKKEASLYDIGKEIESLKRRVVEIKNRREEYGIANMLANLKVQQRKMSVLLRTTAIENQVDVVGFEDDFRALLAELIGEDPSLKLIAIHGMGGLGKTTLANKIYNSSELSRFKIRAKVCVSQEYNIGDVLRKIIRSFMGHDLDLWKMDEVDLLQHLRKLLDGDKYIVLIDDIWDLEAWEMIKKAFPDKKNGSRIIITTRNKNVAQRVDDRCLVHELRFLREDESWQLFCKRVEPAQNLEKLGKDMVGKCQGLPLAIVVLSGLLLHKKNYDDWSKVKDHIWRQLKGNSVEIQEILSLSYNDLSFQTRQCFLYLARFPEDQTFRVHKLKQIWIAEEFISEADEGDGIFMEDVAEDNLNELINRNMIQIVTLFWDGQVRECRVHDLVHDLAVQKAKEDKFLAIFDSSKQQPSSLLQGQPRHTIYNGIGKYLESLGPSPDDLKLRSLALIYGTRRVELEEIKLMCMRFKYIKVLDMLSVSSRWIPEEIGDLVLLKFLGLMHGISEPLVIPPTIGKLKRLQTLCGSLSYEYKFPREICDLKELRHLNFLNFSQRLARGSLKIGNQQVKLQTLDIWYEDWIQVNTVNLTNLRTLVITDASIKGGAYTLDSISNLKSLQKFFLEFHTTPIPTIKPLSSCKRLKSIMFTGRINDPSELRFLPDSVMVLSINGSEFTEDPMPILGSLPNLTGLDLDDVYVGQKMVCSPNSFQCLRLFELRNLPNLEEWQVEDGALPSLKGFELEYCDKLKIIPEQVKCVPPIPAIFYN
ncbi:hypothetical protein ACET3Z_014718 [Daucus carota]